MKLTTDSVVRVAGRTATGRDAEVVSREFIERTEHIRPLITRAEIDTWVAEQRRIWEQKNQQQ